MAEKASGKVLWIFPKNTANEFLGALIVTVVLSLIWSFVMDKTSAGEHAWLALILWLILAALIGWYVGMVRGNAAQSTLWIAAGFAALGALLTQGLMANASANVDAALVGALEGSGFTIAVSGTQIVLAIVAAVFATIGSKSKM